MAEKNSLSKAHEPFENGEAFLTEMLVQLDQMAANIKVSATWHSFGDEHRDGNKIIRRVPKREVAIQPLIDALLTHLETQKNISVARESSMGGGDLDFCFSAVLRDGAFAHVCVEVKLAHSHDLAHGLKVQLPAYMKSKATDLGIYLVIDCGTEYAPDLRGLSGDHFDAPAMGPRLALPIAAGHVGPLVRVAFVDASPTVSPSAL